MSVKFKLSDLHIRKQNGTFGDLTALKGDRGLTAVQVSGTQPTDPDIDVWFKDQQSAPVMVYTTDEVYNMGEVDTMRGQTEKNLAYINTGSTADKIYYKDDYLVYNGQLYVVTDTTISQEATLSPGQGGNIKEISITDTLPKISYYSGGPVSVSGTNTNVTWFDAGFTLPTGGYLVFASVIPQSTVPSATGQCRIWGKINGDIVTQAINKTGLGNGNGIQGFAYTNNYFRIGTHLSGTTDAVYFTYNAYVLKIK